MKKLITGATLALGLALSAGNVMACSDVQDDSPFKELDRIGIELKHYTVTDVKVVKGKYTYAAKSSSGEVLKFDESDTPYKLAKWNRVRAFWQDGDLNTVEYVKPEMVEHKVSKTWKIGKDTYYEGVNPKYGGIQFSNKNVEGKYPKVGNTIVAEFDQMYIEGGLIKVMVK